MKNSKYTVFRPHLEHHTDLGEKMEEILENFDELSTPELVEELDKESDMESSFLRSIISDGRDWFIKNNKLEVEERPEGSGGNETIFWRMRK